MNHEKIANNVAENIASFENGVSLRDHQIDGLAFIIKCHQNGHGCILADEMGLGKTCQSVAVLEYLTSSRKPLSSRRGSLIISPLSVIDHWEKEIKKFAPNRTVISYKGSKEERPAIMKQILEDRSWDTVLTTYELILKDLDDFSKIRWEAIIVDEAHRLKNSQSQIYAAVSKLDVKFHLLLTGTPIQNKLEELHALLQLISPEKFPTHGLKAFIEKYKSKKGMETLKDDLKKFMLRRTKDLVCSDIPEKADVILYHGISAVQKNLYKAILTKNHKVFEDSGSGDSGKKQSLINTLMQLRKCINHPYLFPGIEPEPFEEGEHIIEASDKLATLDRLLKFLRKRGHKVLIFSQMTSVLDILQDYLTYRKFSYERLDGSVRSEERFAAVDRFNAREETFAFLLSTRAGGVGLTLTGADTVIFVDSDFNPQNDIQAAARAHRIGQTKPVRVIRLVAKHSVEEIILARAAAKLKLTENVIGSDENPSALEMTTAEITEFLTFGLHRLSVEEESESNEDEEEKIAKSDAGFTKILGDTNASGEWMPVEGEKKIAKSKEKEEKSGEHEENGPSSLSMYVFEGKDYKEEAKEADKAALNSLIQDGKAQDRADGPKKRIPGNNAFQPSALPEPKPRKKLTEEEKEKRRRTREANAARRAAEEEAEEIRREKKRRERKQAAWDKNGYTSCNLAEPTEQENEEESANSDQTESLDPVYVSGDVAHPQPIPAHQNADLVIVHCVDNSGSWPSGGVFSAIEARSREPKRLYSLAKKMGDLSLGDAHLFPVDDVQSRNSDAKDFVALAVAQDKNDRRSIKQNALSYALDRIRNFAMEDPNNPKSVHLPRIGYGLHKVNWYTTLRLLYVLFSVCIL